MNDKTVITQNTPHKVTVSDGSNDAARPTINRGQGGGPSVIETPTNIQTAPMLEEAARAFHAFDEVAQTPPKAPPALTPSSPSPQKNIPTDSEHALLEDWSLSPELVERIDDLRLHNAHIQSQLDRLTAPSPQARA